MGLVLVAASGFGEAVAEAIGAGLAAGLYLLFLTALGLAGGLAVLFLAGLREVPRTTVLAYGLGGLGGALGGALGFPPLALAGAGVGAVVGWRMEDLPLAVFRSRPYTLLLAGSGAVGVLLGAELVRRYLAAFGHLLGENLVAGGILLGVLAFPAVAGAAALVMVARDR